MIRLKPRTSKHTRSRTARRVNDGTRSQLCLSDCSLTRCCWCSRRVWPACLTIGGSRACVTGHLRAPCVQAPTFSISWLFFETTPRRGLHRATGATARIDSTRAYGAHFWMGLRQVVIGYFLSLGSFEWKRNFLRKTDQHIWNFGVFFGILWWLMVVDGGPVLTVLSQSKTLLFQPFFPRCLKSLDFF